MLSKVVVGCSLNESSARITLQRWVLRRLFNCRLYEETLDPLRGVRAGRYLIWRNMGTNPISELCRLALAGTQDGMNESVLTRAMKLLQAQTGSISTFVFYSDHRGNLVTSGVGDDPTRLDTEAISYLQQRLVQLHVPLAFDVDDGKVSFITRATSKQRRDYFAWRVPVPDSFTEMVILRGAWPPSAVEHLLDAVESAMPALMIILEFFVDGGRRQRLERQLKAIDDVAEMLRPTTELLASLGAVYSANRSISESQSESLRQLAEEMSGTLGQLRASGKDITSHLRLQEYASRLERAVEVERQNAQTDSLTGLPNHGGGLLALNLALDEARNSDKALSVLIGDIDNFKLFNDTYGHVAGDDILRVTANQCLSVVGDGGTVSRYGGDEFLIVLPGKDKNQANGLKDEILKTLGSVAFRSTAKDVVPVGMSLGVASYPDDGESLSKLLANADSAMYAAKRNQATKVEGAKAANESSFGVLDSLVLAIDTKDRYTKDHCDIVAEYAVKLAQRLGLSEESEMALRVAGLLHDVGKIAVPDEILKKPAPLTEEERTVMRRHVRMGEVIIREVPQLKDVIQAVSCHHERYDGSGYPRNLAGEKIPLLGRIIAIADAFSAMSLDRPYRKALSSDTVITELLAGAGVQFDPDLVRSFVDMLFEEQLRGREAA